MLDGRDKSALAGLRHLSGSPSSSMRLPPVAPIIRAKLGSSPANGHTAFLPQIRKLVFEYCDRWPSSANARTFLLNHVEDVARQNPHVEVVVRQRTQKEPIIRGFYSRFLKDYPNIPC